MQSIEGLELGTSAYEHSELTALSKRWSLPRRYATRCADVSAEQAIHGNFVMQSTISEGLRTGG